MGENDDKARRGRPRREADDIILEVTLALLRSRGYLELTLNDVAREAGVAKTTLYRRWPSKGALVAAAIAAGVPATSAERGALLKERLLALAGHASQMAGGEFGATLAAVAGESGVTGDAPTADAVMRLLAPDALRSEIADTLVEMVVGAVWVRARLERRQMEMSWLAELASKVAAAAESVS